MNMLVKKKDIEKGHGKMIDYIELNKKNTEYLISISNEKRNKILKQNRYLPQLSIFGKYVNKKLPVLDIGIRDGAFLEVLRNEGFIDLCGIDIYEKSVELGNKKGFDCVVADAHYFNLNKKFGTIVMSHSLEHCPYPDKVIERVYEHLLDNGILFIEVPREEGDPKPTVKDAHYYNFNDMDSLLDLFDDRWEILKKLIQGKNDCRLKIVIRKRSMEE